MKRTQGFGVVVSLGLIVLGMVAFGTSPAGAQTVAPGPYYATPSWDQTLACTTLANCPRFIVLSNMGSNAVLDRETGLVWEKSPSTTRLPWSSTPPVTNAATHCNQLATGGRLGWRLPTLQELASLVDPDASGAPFLPPGHPFNNVQSDFGARYWSATTLASNSSVAWVVNFNNGSVGVVDKGGDFVHFTFAWCVRAGQGVDPQ